MIELLAQATSATPNDAALAWGIVLVAVAVILLFLELLLPSGGILSICAAVAVIGSLVAFFTFSPQIGFIVLGLYVLLGPLVLWLGFKWWVSSSLGRRMILGAEDDPLDRTPDEAFAASNEAQRERARYMDGLVDMEGVSETPLRPVGTVRLANGERHEALAESGVIEAKSTIRVVCVQDNQLKVRAI